MKTPESPTYIHLCVYRYKVISISIMLTPQRCDVSLLVRSLEVNCKYIAQSMLIYSIIIK